MVEEIGSQQEAAEQLLEECLTLLEDGDEALVLLHVPQRLEPQGPFVVDGPQHGQRLGQHPAHAPYQQRLFGGERVAGAGDGPQVIEAPARPAGNAGGGD